MADLLFWLALPLLTIPWLPGPRRPGAAAAHIIMAGFGLAALQLGAGTLDPGDLRMIAGQSSRDAWFVGITAGLMMSGSCAPMALRHRCWLPVIAALPLLTGLIVAGAGHLLPLAVGLGLGLVPWLISVVAANGGRTAGEDVGRATSGRIVEINTMSVVLALAMAIMARFGPALFALVGFVVLVWREQRRADATIHLPVLPVTGTALLAAWGWFALTIAGSPLMSLRTLAMDAPIAPAAEPALALIAILWGVVLSAPWPLDRLARVAVQLPVVAVVLHLAGLPVTPEGMAHWQPLLTAMLVVAALAAMAARRWDGAAAAVMLLGITRSGALPFAGGLAVAIAPAIRDRLTARMRSAAAGVAMALVVAGMLRDQVLLSVLLALGAAGMAHRTDHVVAGPEGPVHL